MRLKLSSIKFLYIQLIRNQCKFKGSITDQFYYPRKAMFDFLSSRYQNKSLPNQKANLSFSVSPRPSQLSDVSSPEELSLKRKVNRIALLNLNEHDLDICACEQCIYRRQLNRKQRINLDMSKNSSYRHQYSNKNTKIGNQPALFKIDYETIQRDKHNKSTVIDNSNYNNDFASRPYGKPIKSRPEDELKFNGPSKQLSAYNEQYPSYRNNANPYVKPVQIMVPNSLKMNLKSSYQANYSGVSKLPAESGKRPDQLHCGLPWTGGSTYKQMFQNPSSSETLNYDSGNGKLDNINYKHQYETIYRNEYPQGQLRQCNRGRQTSLNPLLASLTADI